MEHSGSRFRALRKPSLKTAVWNLNRSNHLILFLYQITYIIYGTRLNRYYVGHCEDIEERLRRHNNGNGATYTKKAKDWQLKWTENFVTRKQAASREGAINKKKSRKYIEFLILKGGMV